MVNQVSAAPDKIELSNTAHPELKRGPVQNSVEKYLAIESLSLRISLDRVYMVLWKAKFVMPVKK